MINAIPGSKKYSLEELVPVIQHVVAEFQSLIANAPCVDTNRHFITK